MTKKGRFQQIGEEIGSLVEEKNAAYGNSFGKVAEFLKILWPDGIPVEAYTDALCTVRMFDKLMRIANKKDAFGESPYRDIAGYSILGVEKDERESNKTQSQSSSSSQTEPIQETLEIEASKLFFSPEQVEQFKTQQESRLKQVQAESIKQMLQCLGADEALVLRAQMQEDYDRKHLPRDEAYLATADVQKQNSISTIEKWLSENTKHPDSNKIEVWKLIHWVPSMYDTVLNVGDIISFVDHDGLREGLRVEGIVGCMAVVYHDAWDAPKKIDLSSVKNLKKKITIEFASEQERNNWYEILKSSNANENDVIDKFVDKFKIETEVLVESKAAEQNHNIVATVESDSSVNDYG